MLCQFSHPNYSCCLLHTSGGYGGDLSQGHQPPCLGCIGLCCIHIAPCRIWSRFCTKQAAFKMKLGQLVFPYVIHPSVKLCLLAVSIVRLGSSRVFHAPRRPSSSTGRGDCCHSCLNPALHFLILAATHLSSHEEQVPRETANPDGPSGSCLLPASLVYAF